MGASSSSISQLPSNEYLLRLCGNSSISPNDPFWNQLLSYSFHVPCDSSNQRLLEESTNALLHKFSLNNNDSGNLGALVRVFLVRATWLRSAGQTDDSIFTWQTYNALFIIRNITKYLVENHSESEVLHHFDIKQAQCASGDDYSAPMVEELLTGLMELCIDLPVQPHTYSLHLETVNTFLVLLAVHMFQSSPTTNSQLYKSVMQGKCSLHASAVMCALMQNFIEQVKCPKELLQFSQNSSALYGITSAVASGLWSVLTLGMGSGSSETSGTNVFPLLSNQSLLLILVLANHCSGDGTNYNPYRHALLNLHDGESQGLSEEEEEKTFCLELSCLYQTFCDTVFDDQTTLLLYLLIHRNENVREFILSRTNIDQLLMPMLQVLYCAQDHNSHHVYMTLIVVLVLTEDDCFSKAIHEVSVGPIAWFRERQLTEISLGGLLLLVLIRTIQFNLTRMRDKYLHTNCLAAMANMSSRFDNLHPFPAQKLVNLFGQLLKRHARLVEQIRIAADKEVTDEDQCQDLPLLEELIRMVLEILNSCLTHALHHNPNLIYTLLYQKDLFISCRTHPTFQDIIQNIDTVINFFSTRIEVHEKTLSVPQTLAIIKQGSLTFKIDRLRKFPELKFRYVEEEEPQEFFLPYVWSLVFHSSRLYFNSKRIQLLSVQECK